MFEFQNDKKKYFDIQYKITAEYIIPYLSDKIDLSKKRTVLEIGCAEAGVLKAFTDTGHQCMGIELSSSRTKLAEQFMSKEIEVGSIRFLNKNIYDINVMEDIGHKFDLIILKDVIEHIPNQELFMQEIKAFMKPEGKIFFGFPPWQMPFGGHQQICNSKFVKYLPYFHMLPMQLFKGILKLAGESKSTIKEMQEIKETGISIERFNKILKKENYLIEKRQLFLTNPIYKYKFGLKVRKQIPLFSNIPYLRNFVSTCAYYLISKQ